MAMNEHLTLVRAFHDAFSFPQAKHGADEPLSDMDIIMRQALLMEEGAEVFKALAAAGMVAILDGLVDLGYYALGGLAMRGVDIVEQPVSWRHDGYVLSVMRLLSDTINNCATGSAESYSELYCTCVHLARSFLNADFDKAFRMVHESNMSRLDERGRPIHENAWKIRKSKLFKAPDLSECLYE